MTRKLFKVLDQKLARVESFFYERSFLIRLSVHNLAHISIIRQNQFNFHSFFVCLQLCMSINADEKSTTNKQFRIAIQSTFKSSVIKATLWQNFWHLAPTYVQRNVLYRLTSDKTLHKQLLHRFQPTQFPSGLYFTSQEQPDSDAHSFFTCSQKSPFWDTLI